MSLTSFVTSLFSTVYADAPAEESKVEEPTAEETPEASEEVASEAASEEDEEPEDVSIPPMLFLGCVTRMVTDVDCSVAPADSRGMSEQCSMRPSYETLYALSREG